MSAHWSGGGKLFRNCKIDIQKLRQLMLAVNSYHNQDSHNYQLSGRGKVGRGESQLPYLISGHEPILVQLNAQPPDSPFVHFSKSSAQKRAEDSTNSSYGKEQKINAERIVKQAETESIIEKATTEKRSRLRELSGKQASNSNRSR